MTPYIGRSRYEANRAFRIVNSDFRIEIGCDEVRDCASPKGMKIIR